MEGLTYRQASRFLDMATMGLRDGDVEAFLAIDDRDTWVTQQLAEGFANHEERLAYQRLEIGGDATQAMRVGAWFDIALWTGAQLRQRVAFALSQILVVSDRDGQLAPHPVALAHYYDMLTTHAFSDYKTLLYHVTRSPVMGHFLTMVGNLPKSQSGVDPDQNYAREVMQLFTIGLEELNMDGTLKLDGEGNPIPTYDDETIRNVARIFTGWFVDSSGANGTMYDPMVAFDDSHDMDEKTVFGVTFPAGVGAEQELDAFLDLLVDHPNTAPYISTLLIKRLVTSNPRPEYVARVANVFVSSGGNLGEVIKAILTDSEVLKEGDLHVAKVREPILAMTHFYRATDARPKGGSTTVRNPMDYQNTFGQYPLGAPSVFNFFSPNSRPSGPLRDNNLTAPELSLIDWNQVIRMGNVLYKTVLQYGQDRNKTDLATEMYTFPDDLEAAANAGDVETMLTIITRRFLNGVLTPEIEAHLRSIYDVHGTKRYAVPKMVFFAAISPNFMVQE
ncbi:DUF1800 domain-containing protein [Thaumasiovibrio subtropicus]|uniref:DUF1800 domain-containing protein n=1 Tax=Thaumasiovibrio subtropicus TaxID=1891207 RepID=UPI000B350C4E|nr:DUF1800 family protein [Thaumasiovibrio subtropicus]